MKYYKTKRGEAQHFFITCLCLERSERNGKKYENLRTRIKGLYEENKKQYGYRRIHASLKRENMVISEKIIRRIMRAEGLIVKIKKQPNITPMLVR